MSDTFDSTRQRPPPTWYFHANIQSRVSLQRTSLHGLEHASPRPLLFLHWHPSKPSKATLQHHQPTDLNHQHIPDTDPNANPRGLALRFLLSADEHKHTDIIAHSTPFFPTRTGEGFLAMLRALGDGSIGSFLEATPSAAAFVQAPKPSPASFATEKYFGVNAFTLISADGGKTSVRYRIAPEAGVETLSEDEVKGKSETYLFDEIVERLAGSSIKFKLMAQVAQAGDPTDDATQHWPEDREVVELGTIELKEILSEQESRKLEKNVIFDPIPRVEGVEASDDPLLDVRAAVYLISGKGRRAAE